MADKPNKWIALVLVGRWRSVARAAVSLLLALCFVLPLSSCERLKVEGSSEAVTTHITGVAMAREALDAIASADWGSGILLLAVFNVFFAPLLYLRLAELRRATATLASSLVSAYVLAFWVFIFGRPQAGGMIAVACWTFLFADSTWTLSTRLCRRLWAPAQSG